jgi:hypothetical protein
LWGKACQQTQLKRFRQTTFYLGGWDILFNPRDLTPGKSLRLRSVQAFNGLVRFLKVNIIANPAKRGEQPSNHPKGEMGSPLGFELQTTAKPETRKMGKTTRVCMGESVG